MDGSHYNPWILLCVCERNADFWISQGIQHTQNATNFDIFVWIVSSYESFPEMCCAYQTLLGVGVKFIASGVNALIHRFFQLIFYQAQVLVRLMTFFLHNELFIEKKNVDWITTFSVLWSEEYKNRNLTSYFWWAPYKYDDGFWLFIAKILFTHDGTFCSISCSLLLKMRTQSISGIKNGTESYVYIFESPATVTTNNNDG